MTDALITADILKTVIGKADLRLIDATWTLADGAAPGRKAFEILRIPKAVFLDIDEVSDKTQSLPHMAPSADDFAGHMGALGITATDHVVVYDQTGIFSAPRVWWMLKAFGHQRVSVLDGGLPAWRANGGSLETDAPRQPTRRAYGAARLDPARLSPLHHVQNVVSGRAEARILDARPAARFNAIAPEPRAGLRSGAMPGAQNLPFSDLLTSDGRLKPAYALRQAFALRGVNGPDKETVVTCGSGVSAALIALAHEALGWGPAALYDGSWAEWGAPDPAGDRPVVASGGAH